MFLMGAKLFPVFEGQGRWIRRAAGRPDVTHAVSHPNRRDFAHPVAEFPKKARKLLGAADGLPIQLRRAQLNLPMHELLRCKDVQGVLAQQADGELDLVFRRPQSAAAILPARQGDHNR